tara:strand:- start:423 stop:845 length:423 start_codon:yes stop_codon:yes gene_type:complete
MNHLTAELKRIKKQGSEQRIIAMVRFSDENFCDLELSVPPTVNNYYAQVGKRRVITKKGRIYKEAVSRLNVTKLTGRIGVTVELFAKDKRRRDLDNILKCLLDSLGGCGVYEDDSQVDRLVVARCEKDPRHIVKVYVERL